MCFTMNSFFIHRTFGHLLFIFFLYFFPLFLFLHVYFSNENIHSYLEPNICLMLDEFNNLRDISDSLSFHLLYLKFSQLLIYSKCVFNWWRCHYSAPDLHTTYMQGHLSTMKGEVPWHLNPEGFGLSCAMVVDKGVMERP